MLKVALAQIEIYAGQPARNAEKILNFIEQAKNQNADIVVFPANAISGAFIGDNLQKESFLRDCKFFEQKIFDASTDITVIFGSRDKIFVASDRENLPSEEYLNRLDYNIDIAAKPFWLGESYVPVKNDFLSIYVNAVGIQNRGKTIYTFDGRSAVYNSRGEIVHRLEPFAEMLSVVDIMQVDKMPTLENFKVSETAQIYHALSYGVEKFLKQIGVDKVVIGISGGIDSAVAAALYTKILGAENIYLVNMPSVFNSATTRGLSEQLAKNLGCNYAVVPIQESVDFTVKQLENTPFVSRDKNFNLQISNFVKENIQARDRSGRILAAVAASVGGVFTCNANKAETTVGYATLYGDEAGFFCALADLWKFQVYNLARYLNQNIYNREVIPQGIIDIVPSAELSNAQNVDEGKGDPLKYPYHDFLFRAFMEDGMSPEDILNWYVAGTLENKIGCEVGLVQKYFPTAKDFIADLERWWKLFTGMAVAKRIQSPPILAVSRRAYGADYAESQYPPYFTQAYENLKASILENERMM